MAPVDRGQGGEDSSAMTEAVNGHAPMTEAGRGHRLTVAAAAARLAVSPPTVRRYIQAGTLVGELVRTARGEEYLVDEAAVMTLANVRSTSATGATAAGLSDPDRGQPRSAAADRGHAPDMALLRAFDLVAERD